MNVIKFVIEHGAEIVAGVVATCNGLIALCLVIPGEQPEKALQKVVNFISKFSRKKSEIAISQSESSVGKSQ